MRLFFNGPDALAQIQLHEEYELAKPALVRESDLNAKLTEPIVRGQMKSRFTCYRKQRAEGKYNGSLLRKIKNNIALYCLIVPGFWSNSVLSIQDVQAVIDALPEGKSRPWRNGYEHLAEA